MQYLSPFEGSINRLQYLLLFIGLFIFIPLMIEIGLAIYSVGIDTNSIVKYLYSSFSSTRPRGDTFSIFIYFITSLIGGYLLFLVNTKRIRNMGGNSKRMYWISGISVGIITVTSIYYCIRTFGVVSQTSIDTGIVIFGILEALFGIILFGVILVCMIYKSNPYDKGYNKVPNDKLVLN